MAYDNPTFGSVHFAQYLLYFEVKTCQFRLKEPEFARGFLAPVKGDGG
jgi:hypothetical protein